MDVHLLRKWVMSVCSKKKLIREEIEKKKKEMLCYYYRPLNIKTGSIV